ncbi:hypothetical protein ACFL1R_12035 [Candidatus Latescibacterota bacterium]
MFQYIHKFRFGEQTIVMSTHIVNEVEEFVEDVIYLKKGEKVLSGVTDRLREEKGTSLEGYLILFALLWFIILENYGEV